MDSAQDAESQVVSSSLLRGLEPVTFEYNPAFNLGCIGWGAENIHAPTRKHLCLSLKKKKEPLKEANARFASPTKKEVFDAASEGVVPTNTRSNTKWAVKTFTEWMEQRNERVAEDPIPHDILKLTEAAPVCKFMRLFVLETRRSDGTPYPPATLWSLVSGIQRAMQANKVPFLLLDRSDDRFRELHLTLDSVSSDLHRQGVGAVRKSAAVISSEDEDLFWEKGLLGTTSPAVLQHTVFFYVGLHFVLRGVQEQHDFLVEQLERVPLDVCVYSSDVYYKYTEYISKNNQHRFKDARVRNKEGKVYAHRAMDVAWSSSWTCTLVNSLHPLPTFICALFPRCEAMKTSRGILGNVSASTSSRRCCPICRRKLVLLCATLITPFVQLL